MPRLGGKLPAVIDDPVSRCLFHFRPDWAGQDAETGEVLCVTDHRLTFSRGGNTLAAVATSSGSTYTAAASQVAWEPRTLWDGSIRFGVRSSLNDTLHTNEIPAPQAWAFDVGFICDSQPGTSYFLCGFTSLLTTDPAFLVQVLPSAYRVQYTTDGSTEVHCDIARTSGDNGKYVRLYGAQSASGVLTLSRTVDGGSVTSGTPSSALAPVAWAANTELRIGGAYGSANGLAGWHGGVKLVAGAPSATLLQETW